MQRSVPITTNAEDRVLALSGAGAPSIAETLAAFSAAIGSMNADDVTLEIDNGRDGTHLRMRAYRHRR